MPSEIRAEFRRLKPEADAAEMLIHDRQNINRGAHTIGVIYYSDAQRMPIDVFSLNARESRTEHVRLSTLRLADSKKPALTRRVFFTKRGQLKRKI